MTNFKPFKGIHAKKEFINDFPTYSPEILSEEEIKGKLKGKKTNYLNLIKPIFFKGESPLENRLKKIKKRYEDYLINQYFDQDEASFYIYEQRKLNGDIFKGIIGLISVNNFEKEIKIPEQIKSKKHEDISKFLDITSLQTNPALLCYENNFKLDVMIDLEMKGKPAFHLIDKFNHSHRIWKVNNRLKIAQFKEAVENLPSLYLADGLNRVYGTIEHSNKVKEKKKKKNFLEDQHHQVMSLITSSQNLKIYECNRLIKSLENLSSKEFLEKLKERFIVNKKGEIPYFPSHSHHISMYLEGVFYSLYIKHEYRSLGQGLGNIDVYLFDKFILNDILSFSSSEESKSKIEYLKGTSNVQGIIELKNKVDSKEYQVGFGFYPPLFKDLQYISDLDLKIPKRSAYIEPKFLLGMILFDMK